MAGINILGKNAKKIIWNDFLEGYSKLNLTSIEVFPIPQELGFKEDCIGACVHSDYNDKTEVLNQLKVLVDFLLKRQFKMTELYDGMEISTDNVIPICDKLLG